MSAHRHTRKRSERKQRDVPVKDAQKGGGIKEQVYVLPLHELPKQKVKQATTNSISYSAAPRKSSSKPKHRVGTVRLRKTGVKGREGRGGGVEGSSEGRSR